MMTLLRVLHSIAARRGDGLRPELLGLIPPSPTWTDVERTGRATKVDEHDVKSVHENEEVRPICKILIMQPRKRD